MKVQDKRKLLFWVQIFSTLHTSCSHLIESGHLNLIMCFTGRKVWIWWTLISVEYTITVSIKAGSIHYGTAADQFVKIKGSEGLTEELHCDADFDVNGQDVQCTVASSKYIGDVRCIVWRTTTTDGWDLVKVNFKTLLCIDIRFQWNMHCTSSFRFFLRVPKS